MGASRAVGTAKATVARVATAQILSMLVEKPANQRGVVVVVVVVACGSAALAGEKRCTPLYRIPIQLRLGRVSAEMAGTERLKW